MIGSASSVKQRLASGRACLGPNLQLDHPWMVEIMGLAGFDFVLLDGEHGSAFASLASLVTAADAAGIAPFVRVPSMERGWIVQALELGAHGIQVPMVETVEQAETLVAETKYAPVGRRGFSNATRAAQFGAVPAGDLADVGNARQMLILQLETPEGIANAEAIARVEGVDVVFFGPADFAQSMGHPGNPTHPEVNDRLDYIIDRLAGHVNIGIGVSPDLVPSIEGWARAGVRYFLTGSTHTLRQAFAEHEKTLRAAVDAGS